MHRSSDKPTYHLVNDHDFQIMAAAVSRADLGRNPLQGARGLLDRIDSGKPLVDLQAYVCGEWTGLYVDGKLAAYGDSYIIEEYLEQMIGLTSQRGDDSDNKDWLEDGVRTPFKTLEEVLQRTADRETREQTAADLRREAQRLLDDADALERAASDIETEREGERA